MCAILHSSSWKYIDSFPYRVSKKLLCHAIRRGLLSFSSKGTRRLNSERLLEILYQKVYIYIFRLEEEFRDNSFATGRLAGTAVAAFTLATAFAVCIYGEKKYWAQVPRTKSKDRKKNLPPPVAHAQVVEGHWAQLGPHLQLSPHEHFPTKS